MSKPIPDAPILNANPTIHLTGSETKQLTLSGLRLLVDSIIKEHGDLPIRDVSDGLCKGLEVIEYHDDVEDWDIKAGDKVVRMTPMHWSDFPRD